MFSPSLKTNFKLGAFGEHSRVIARSERQRNSGGSIIKRNRYDNFGAYDLFSSERKLTLAYVQEGKTEPISKPF